MFKWLLFILLMFPAYGEVFFQTRGTMPTKEEIRVATYVVGWFSTFKMQGWTIKAELVTYKELRKMTSDPVLAMSSWDRTNKKGHIFILAEEDYKFFPAGSIVGSTAVEDQEDSVLHEFIHAVTNTEDEYTVSVITKLILQGRGK